MKNKLTALGFAATIAMSSLGVALADEGGVPDDSACRGQLIKNIASTWPWAQDHVSYPPPKGALALWIDLFMGGDRDAFNAYVDAACSAP